MFTAVVREQWGIGEVATNTSSVGDLHVVIDDHLPPSRSLTVLELAGGGGVVIATADQASVLGLTRNSMVRRSEVHSAIVRAGIAMHDPDALFYFQDAEQSDVRHEPARRGTRRLTMADAEAFAELTSLAPADDVDDAFVELSHWLVYGTFVDGHLASIASTYPWSGTRLADIGVITLPRQRSRGLATRTVRAISAAALRRGFEPQYRCQLDNHASIALARAAGFSRFGNWHVIESSDADD